MISIGGVPDVTKREARYYFEKPDWWFRVPSKDRDPAIFF